MRRAWCPDCRRRQDVVGTYVEDTGDSRVMVEAFTVTELACGHDVQSEPVVVGRSSLRQAGESRAHVLGRQAALAEWAGLSW